MSTKPVWTNAQITSQLLRDNYQWQRTVDYQFAPSGEFNATQKAATALAFQYVSDVANISFVQTAYTSNLDGHITFNNANLGAGLWGNTNWTYFTNQVNGHLPVSHAEVQVNTMYTGVNSTYAFGTYDFFSLFHEIGHAIGEDHPGFYDEGGATYSRDAIYAQDSRQYTVMSYFDASNTGGDHNGHYASTPLLDDVMAMQAWYGANMTTRTGDTTYGFNNTSGRAAFDFTVDTNPVVAIWDAGGNDTIDLSGYTMSCKLDLNQGAFSDVGGMVANVAVCFNAVIENGIGGSDDDQIIGNAANNGLYGGNGDDVLTAGTGSDTLDGGNGNDTLIFGANYGIGDSATGGSGTDTLSLSGSYSSLMLSGLSSIEVISVAAGGDYNFTLADLGSGITLRVDGSDLSTGDAFTVNGTLDLGGALTVLGGAGADTFTGTGYGDTFEFDSGFSAADHVDGGAGADTLFLNGAMGSVTFGAGTMTNIETLRVGTGHSYSLTLADGNVASGATLTVDGSALSAGDALAFRGSADTNSNFSITGGTGNDSLTGGSGLDTINGGAGDDALYGGNNTDVLVSGTGNDIVSGGNGADTLKLDGDFNSLDVVDGGGGVDTLMLNGNYSLVFAAAMMVNVETISLSAGHDYTLTFDDGNVAAGARLTVDGSHLAGADKMVIDGSHELDGAFTITGGAASDTFTGGNQSDVLTGGAGNDTLSGGAGVDTLNGGLGADMLDGGANSDTFVYGKAKESTKLGYDSVVGFDASSDRFDLSKTVTGVDTWVTTGKLSQASFTTNLKAAIDSTHLAKDHAVLFTADSGDMAGQTFLVIDTNGMAGYQAGRDLVVHLDTGMHLSGLDVSDFI